MSDDIVSEFLIESNENLDLLDRELVLLERDPSNKESLASIFRAIHTIKGTCGFLGFDKLQSVAHVGENLLSRLRDGELALTEEITTALLVMVDSIRQMLTCVETTRTEGEGDYSELIKTITRLQANGNSTSTASPDAGATREVKLPAALVEDAPKPATSDSSTAMSFDGESTNTPRILSAAAEPITEPQRHVPDASQAQAASRAGNEGGTIRVDVGLLDKLMNLVGELVLARNQVLQFTSTTTDSGLVATSQRLNLITTELQESVMKTRMQPIGNVWTKFPRTVRDVATTCGKQVRIEMEGKETELDKTIIEAIKDPLTHIVRNSVDHGIEIPEKRVANGKPAEGMLLLRAYHEGGQVNIEISDDGAGIDPDKLRRKAVEKALITQDQASRMGEREALNLIFLAGFSTAEKVTNVSGRGVGMDVVKTNIEKIGGMVDVQSRLTKGTTIRMKIPLTLAIIPALIVTSSGDRYAIPQISLLELVRLEGGDARKQIESIQGTPVYRLRGRLLPLVYLNRELKLDGKEQSPAAGAAVNIVVLQADERQFGLVVDEINDTEEIVVKPLGKQLKGVKAFAGSTIMGDGCVALILDVLGIAQSASVVGENREAALAEKQKQAAAADGQKQTMLLLQCGANGRMAMDLSLVARLEEFKPEMVERAGDCEVVQYRGQIMPLIRVGAALRLPGAAQSGSTVSTTMQVVVYSAEGRSVGLVVDHIVDIVEEVIRLQRPSERPGLLGSAVIQQHVTDVLDVHNLVLAASPTSVRPSS